MSGNVNVADSRTNGGAGARGQSATTARGLLAEPYNLSMAAANTAVASQQIWGALIGLSAGDIVTNIVVPVNVAGAGATPTLIKLGLVAPDGTVLATTANVAADPKWTATGLQSFALSTPYQVTADGGYYVVFLQNGVFGTTPLQILRVGAGPAQAGQSAGSGARLFTLAGTGKTDIVSPLTLVDSGGGITPWFGVS